MERKGKIKTLVLSAGGIKGLMMLGALQSAYDNEDLSGVVSMTGTSCGSIICLLVAIGYSPLEIMINICRSDAMKKIPRINVASAISVRCIASFSFGEFLREMCMEKIGKIPTMEEVKREFGISLEFCTFNYTKKRVEYLNHLNRPDLSCLDAVRMSSNVPFVFEDFEVGGSLYVDGGLCDPFPVDPETEEKTLGITIDPFPSAYFSRESSFAERAYNTSSIPVSTILRNRLDACSRNGRVKTITLDHDVPFFYFPESLSEQIKMYKKGYNDAKTQIESGYGELENR